MRPITPKQEHDRRVEIIGHSKTLAEAAEQIGIGTSALHSWMTSKGLAPGGRKAVLNTMNEQGANRIAGIIKAYWEERGYDVNVEVRVARYDNSNTLRFEVRSDMVNGFPVRRLQ
jgi:hypothetical protein